MYNFSIFDEARKFYAIPELPFLNTQRNLVMDTQPYKGIKILHNIPLTLATAFKVEILALGGAEVVVSSMKLLPPEQRAIDLLRQANFDVQLTHDFKEVFDFHLDCCAELIHIKSPSIATVELTQTGSKIYQSAITNYPVISVDDSDLKVLETFFGTGDGFTRALYQHVGDKMHNKSYVIFGYGKVGRGIAHALKKYTNHITVIDPTLNTSKSSEGIHYINANEKTLISQIIKKSFCAITATGIKDLISTFYSFNKSDFETSLLVNMGADDEYGSNFLTSDVVYDKKPFNFSLEEPTSYRYLDPIFYAHNLGIDIALSSSIQQGYNPFPAEIASNILNQWRLIYNEDLNIALEK